jgi:hypothetical protein
MKALEMCNAWIRGPTPHGGWAESGFFKLGCYGFLSNISSWKWAQSKDTQYDIDMKVVTALTTTSFQGRVWFVFYIKVLQFHLAFIETSSHVLIENGSHTHIHNKSHILYMCYTMGIMIAWITVVTGSKRNPAGSHSRNAASSPLQSHSHSNSVASHRRDQAPLPRSDRVNHSTF